MYKFIGPVTGEKFVFLFFRENGEIIEFNHWSQIINYKDELKVSSKSVQFFLRNSCIFPPYTIYANVIMLPIGSSVEVDIEQNIYNWTNDFKFLDECSRQNSLPSTKTLKTLIGDAFTDLKEKSNKVYMMQSAGKDSTAMLLGLQEVGFTDVHCVTYEASFRDSESDAAKKIAESLGFEHTILYPDYQKEFDALLKYQENALNITGDFSMMPYIAANYSVFEKNSIVIDGLGNDLYMGYVSNKLERRIMKYSMPSLKRFEPSKFTSNEVINYGLSCLFMEPYERLVPGTKLSSSEIENFTGNSFVDEHKGYYRSKYKELDRDDFRAAIRARSCDSTMFQMKAELTTNGFGNQVYFPFSNKNLVDYYFNLPQSERYDKPNGVNKKLLRDMLNEFVEIDDFFKVKSGFRYNMQEFISKNKAKLQEEMLNCDLLDNAYIKKWFEKHLNCKRINYTSACKAYVLLIFATWRNRNILPVVDEHIADKFNWY